MTTSRFFANQLNELLGGVVGPATGRLSGAGSSDTIHPSATGVANALSPNPGARLASEVITEIRQGLVRVTMPPGSNVHVGSRLTSGGSEGVITRITNNMDGTISAEMAISPVTPDPALAEYQQAVNRTLRRSAAFSVVGDSTSTAIGAAGAPGIADIASHTHDISGSRSIVNDWTNSRRLSTQGNPFTSYVDHQTSFERSEPIKIKITSHPSLTREQALDILRTSSGKEAISMALIKVLQNENNLGFLLRPSTHTLLIKEVGINVAWVSEYSHDRNGQLIRINVGQNAVVTGLPYGKHETIAKAFDHNYYGRDRLKDLLELINDEYNKAAKEVIEKYLENNVLSADKAVPMDVATTLKVKEELEWLKKELAKDKIISSNKVSFVLANVEKLLSKV